MTRFFKFVIFKGFLETAKNNKNAISEWLWYRNVWFANFMDFGETNHFQKTIDSDLR